MPGEGKGWGGERTITQIRHAPGGATRELNVEVGRRGPCLSLGNATLGARGSRRDLQLIDLGGEDEIGLAQPADLVRQ